MVFKFLKKEETIEDKLKYITIATLSSGFIAATLTASSVTAEHEELGRGAAVFAYVATVILAWQGYRLSREARQRNQSQQTNAYEK